MKNARQPRVLSREQVIARLEKQYPEMNCMLTENFNGSEGGIWVSGEDGIEDRSGLKIFDYWVTDNKEENYVFGVRKHLHNWANRNGWYFEWHDAGTMMIWKI